MEEKIIKNEIINKIAGGGTPLISVIIPVYNGEKYIADCYKCLKNQTYKNLEIIFINDGSKDNTKNLLDDLAEKDSRVVVIHKENGGVSSARNAGLDIAKGEYISFYDVDDQLDNHFFEVLLNDIFKYDVDIAACQYNWVYEDSTIVNDEFELCDKGVVTFEQCFESYYNHYGILAHRGSTLLHVIWGKIIKKDLVKKLKFRIDISYGEDTLFLMNVITHKPKIFFDSYIGYDYMYRSCGAECSAKSDYIKAIRRKYEHSMAEIEIFNLCCSCCSDTTVLVANNIFASQLVNRVICFLAINSAKTYYQENKYFLKNFIKKMNFKDIPFKRKLYLKLYLFSSPLCWFITRCLCKFKAFRKRK